MRVWRNMAAALVLAGAACAANAGTYSDLWLQPDEPGWGVNVVQQSETAFVTLFVYGADGKPTWYVASDANVIAYSQPGSGRVTPAGEVQLEVLAHDRMLNAENGQGLMRADDQLGRRCEYRGPYRQAGKLIRFSGDFTCSSGDTLAGTFEINDLEVTANGFTGYLRAHSGNQTQFGRFAALLQ